MKTPYLLGIITVLLFGSFALSGMMAQAGPEDLEMIEFDGLPVVVTKNNPGSSEALCPPTHKLISGSDVVFIEDTESSGLQYVLAGSADYPSNTYVLSGQITFGDGSAMVITAKAHCGKINFPMMGIIGGELLDLDTMALFIGAIGVNPVITGLVAITMGGVAAQAIWYVNSRRVKKVE